MYRLRSHFLLIAALLWLSVAWAQADMQVRHRTPQNVGAFRLMYDIDVLRLALEKTRATYGDYQLQAIPPTNVVRTLYSLHNNTYPNLVLGASYDKKLEELDDLTYIPFPLNLGIIGYRICFVNPLIKEEVQQVINLDELRRYTIGQGEGWADVKILRHNGFNVSEVGNYKNLFKMVVGGRFDLLCRGANELMKEYKQFQHIGNLTYDDSFALVYRLPRFFYLNKNNIALKQRLQEGIKIAYADGSLLKLWRQHNLPSIQFTRLPERKLFFLENPSVNDLPKDYEQYLIDPLTIHYSQPTLAPAN
ncbi:hypothetical protein [Cellvibrio sp. OA-2007]|uniref:hypothetical protein n=1 Tax=Cellvibrio sp. OA-2007 TaxID=529823 RepID=UPI0007846430|nr:hypothetical protein [Cellvibrio sp. OA-2007]